MGRDGPGRQSEVGPAGPMGRAAWAGPCHSEPDTGARTREPLAPQERVKGDVLEQLGWLEEGELVRAERGEWLEKLEVVGDSGLVPK